MMHKSPLSLIKLQTKLPRKILQEIFHANLMFNDAQEFYLSKEFRGCGWIASQSVYRRMILSN